MSRPTDFDVVSDIPLVHRRRISWSDSDAARIAYTVRFFEFGMAGIEAWFRRVWGRDYFGLNCDRMGSPFVHIETDILSPLVPGDILDVQVLVEKPGRSSLTFQVLGRKEGGAEVFTGRYTCVIVELDPEMSAVSELPAEPARRVRQYIAECEAAGYAARPVE